MSVIWISFNPKHIYFQHLKIYNQFMNDRLESYSNIAVEYVQRAYKGDEQSLYAGPREMNIYLPLTWFSDTYIENIAL